MAAPAEKKTKRKSRAKIALASDVPEVLPARPSSIPKIGAEIPASSTDLAILNALGDAMVKAKAQAFDQFMAVLSHAGQILDPIDKEFRERVQEAAKKAGCDFSDEDVQWTFILEDGVFRRTK